MFFRTVVNTVTQSDTDFVSFNVREIENYDYDFVFILLPRFSAVIIVASFVYFKDNLGLGCNNIVLLFLRFTGQFSFLLRYHERSPVVVVQFISLPDVFQLQCFMWQNIVV